MIHLPPLGTAEEVASFVKTFKELAKLEGNTLAQEKLLGLPNRPSLFGIPASTPLVSKSHPGVCVATPFLRGSQVRTRTCLLAKD